MAKKHGKKPKPLPLPPDDDWDPRKGETRVIHGKASAASAHYNVTLHSGSGNQRHVIPTSQGGWVVMKPGAARASARVESQGEAVARARRILSNSGGGELVIRDANGRIRQMDVVRVDTSPKKRK